MNFKSMCLAVTILLLAGCAGSTSPSGQPAAAPVAAADAAKETEAVAAAVEEEALDPNEEICKRIKKTGTRQTTKVCATRRQWELSEEQAQDATKRMQQRPQQGKEY